MAEAQGEITTIAGITTVRSYYSLPRVGDQLHQGELLSDVWEWDVEYGDAAQVIGTRPRIHKLAIIVTQECDLVQDFKERKDATMVETELPSVLLCPVFGADELRGRDEISRKFWEIVRTNKAERYQYLAEVPAHANASGTQRGPLMMDFKSYFTVRTIELYRQIRTAEEQSATPITVLDVPWREHLQQRFTNYQARIGLPIDHFIPEKRRNESSDLIS